MKATGIVRRIDDLGRVVIPKEIRRTMRIREGDPLEIYTSNEGEVIFKKYSPIGELSESAAQVADIMHRLAGCPVAVFDRDHVVSVSGAAKKEWNGRQKGSAGPACVPPAGRADGKPEAVFFRKWNRFPHAGRGRGKGCHGMPADYCRRGRYRSSCLSG